MKTRRYSKYHWTQVLKRLGMAAVLLVMLGCSFLDSFKPSSGNTSSPSLLAEAPMEETTMISNDRVIDDDQPGFNIRLSEGQEQTQAAEILTPEKGEPLSSEEIASITARLPKLETKEGDQVGFRLPEEILPPPRPGNTVEESFPPLPEKIPPTAEESGPLEVLRYAPEGELALAPFISVTFNQPMVALSTIRALTNEEAPIKIEPELPGTWTWVGTKTLSFQYDSDLIDRMPMATEYHVSVPAGTRSAVGGELAKEVRWTFTTPVVTMTNYAPHYDSQPLNPIFFTAFDQRIDPQAVLKTIQVKAGSKEVEIVMASEEEIAADLQASNLVKNAVEGRWLAFRAKKPLPANSTITVSVGPGTPSAEGPRLTTTKQSFSFNTYATLRIEEHNCSSNHECRPLQPFFVRFNNPLDAESYKESMITIDPALPGATVSIYGNTLNISGTTEGRTTYRVTISRNLRDTFGQTLGKDEQLTFKVGKTESMLTGPKNTLVTLDPASNKPVLSLYAINYDKIDLKVYAVEPSDWPAFMQYLQEYDRTDASPNPPGRKVRDESMRLETPPDTLTEVSVDLSELVQNGSGHFIVIAKPPKGLFQDKWQQFYQTQQIWVQVTQIGLDAFADHSEMIAWATALKDGAPLSGVNISASTAEVNAVTGKDGIARFELPGEATSYLVAQKGKDRALLPYAYNSWNQDAWKKNQPKDELRWYVFDDRQMYRPGEEVHIKGWMRQIGGAQTGDVTLLTNPISSVNFRVIDPQGNELSNGSTDVSALGGFDLAFTLPANSNLGYAQVIFTAASSYSGEYNHSFQVQEFRRPEFEVTARNETTGPYFAGGSAVVAVNAAYYAGGPLPNAETNWGISANPTSYQPPNWPDFSFGTWTPWWYFDDYSESVSGGFFSFDSVTDASGAHYLRMDFDQPDVARPFSIRADATVMDVNRQAWTGSTSLLVHPAELYVGMRSERYFVERGKPLEISLIVTDIDGNPVTDRPIKVTAARMEWKVSRGAWSEKAADPQECTVGSLAEPVTCTFETKIGGRYSITALVTDEKGRQNQSSMSRWVSGAQRPPARQVEQESVTLIPDKETYQPGDVAHVLVQSPFTPAEGLLTVSRSGILYTERFLMDDGTRTLDIPIEEAHIPNLDIQVDLVGAAPRSDDQGEPLPDVPKRPAFATAQLTLNIPPLLRTLALEVLPAETRLEPGGETSLALTLKDAAGKPVAGAELAVVVVDESVLALSNYQLADPISVFYQTRYSGVSSTYTRNSIVLANPQTLDETAKQVLATQAVAREEAVTEDMGFMALAPAAEPMMQLSEAESAVAGAANAPNTPIAVRSDFNPLATFAPDVQTDKDGKATLKISLPDNLTRYRIMVVAVDAKGNKFGSGEANLTARLPLMVRPSAPRFLNFGDQFELPVILQNQTDETMPVEVIIRTGNIVLTGEAGLRVSIPPNDRIEVRFPAKTDTAGTALFQIAAVSGKYADAATLDLPVYTPATTEAFATYGVVDQGSVAQPIDSPTGVFPQFGGLEITTSSTALQALSDAVLYLVSYPYDCSEQIASRILAVSALRDVLAAFNAEGLPSPEEMQASIVNDIAELQGLQNYDGGYPYWRRGFESIPFNTVHVAHALQRARMMDFKVPEPVLQNHLTYLRNIENHYPHWYSQRTRDTISAYALYVRHLMGDSDAEEARRLVRDRGVEGLSLEALAWIWQVLVDTPDSSKELDSIRRHVNNKVVETAGAANFTTSYGDEAYLLLHSNRRTDALLLNALISDNPNSDLIPKIVTGLLAHRKSGHWNSTQENVFVLLALDRYFNTYEAQTPDFVAHIWLGETYAGSHEYQGYSSERHETAIPMAYLTDAALGGGETRNLILSKEGTGRLYYRLGLRYAPSDLKLDPLEMGFVVQRIYEAVDDPKDVTLDSAGVWHIKAGARVRVRLTMVADSRRYHVALVDPLPAGFETINPALAVSGSVPQDPNSTNYRYGWWWWYPWYEHQNMRDERVEAFASLLWEGVYNYSYVARATTPGTFVAPPAKAEEMYSPEVFGRSASDRVIIE